MSGSRKNTREGRWFERHPKISNSLLLAASLFLSLIFAEIGVRLLVSDLTPIQYRNIHIEDPHLNFRLMPGFVGQTGFVQTRINSKGLRDHERGPKQGFRILGLGDSYTFGHQVELEESYLSVLERLSLFDVVKAGVAGYGLQHEYEYLVRDGVDYDPDLILLGLHVNSDIGQLTDELPYFKLYKGVRYREDEGVALLNRVRRVRAALSYYSSLYYWVIEVNLKSMIYSANSRQVAESSAPIRPNTRYKIEEDLLPDKYRALLVDYLNRFKNFADARDIKLAVLLIPALDDLDSMAQPGRSLYADVLESILAQGLHVIDPRQVLTAEKRVRSIVVSQHDSHWNRYGHAVVGALLQEELQRDGFLPMPNR